MRSPASLAVSWGRVMPSCFIRSVMRGRWFHSAVATSKNECGRELFAISGPILPPTPLIAWHVSQPLVAKTREPAIGSWLGLNTVWAHAPSNATSESATATAPITARIMGDPFCRASATGGRVPTRRSPMLRESFQNHNNYSNFSFSTPASTRAGPGHCRRLPRRRHVPLPAQGRSSELAAPTQNDAHDHESQKTADNKGGDRDTAIGPCRLTVQRRLTVERDLTNDSFFNPCLQKENRRHIDAPLCSRIVQADSR